MKTLYTLIFLTLQFSVSAQGLTMTFEGNNFRWKQSTRAALFYDKANGRAGLEVPIGGGNNTIFDFTLLVSGISPQGDTLMVTQMFCQNPNWENCIGSWGPLKSDLSSNSSGYVQAYNRLWFVTAEQVQDNEAFFDCYFDPDCDVATSYPDYQLPESFVTWPAMGDTAQGYATYLAPFFDRNGDGVYAPQFGDHPVICGDFSAYGITNDVGTENTEHVFPAMGIEIHTQVYGYYADAETSPDLFNTLFVRHRLINRSDNTYAQTRLGSFIDYDIGNPDDDYLRTDVQRSMVVGYNGDGNDEANWSGPGYGNDLPAMGVKVLAGPFMDADGMDNPSISPLFETYGNQGPGWGDGIPDNERFALAHSINTNVGPAPYINSFPFQPFRLISILKGNWYTGDSISYGGSGFPAQGTVPSRYIYPGDSDPLLYGTYGIDPQYGQEGGWTEENEEHDQGDRRLIISSGPFTFAHGDEQYYDCAMVFARDSQEPGVDVMETLRHRADAIQGMECGIPSQITRGDGIVESEGSAFLLYPNPSTGELNISLGTLRGPATVEIYDALGRQIAKNRLRLTEQGQTATMTVSGAPGIYVVKVTGEGFTQSRRWIKSE